MTIKGDYYKRKAQAQTEMTRILTQAQAQDLQIKRDHLIHELQLNFAVSKKALDEHLTYLQETKFPFVEVMD